MNSIFLAAASFHGVGLVLICASWSVIFGFHTPLQSGSLPISAQSCAVGGGLMTAGAFLGASAAWIVTAESAKTEVASNASENAQDRYCIDAHSMLRERESTTYLVHREA